MMLECHHFQIQLNFSGAHHQLNESGAQLLIGYLITFPGLR